MAGISALGTILTNSSIGPSTGRLQLSESLKSDATGVLKAIVEILSTAVCMTQNVPYLGIISSALAELLKIQDEVSTFRSEWGMVLSVVRQFKIVVDRVHAQCERLGRVEDALPMALTEPLTELEKCIAKTLLSLEACKAGSSRLIDRARILLNRADLLNNVRQCRADMQTALDLFNTKLHISNAFAMDAQDKKLDELLGKHITNHATSAPAGTAYQLPPAPEIFRGRDQEVKHVVDLIVHRTPARIAILGPGGIGKTSIALAALHHADVASIYTDYRYVVSCDALLTAEGIVQQLLQIFGLSGLDTKGQTVPRDLLISHVRTLSDVILCFDNLETPWDADVQAVETLLAHISSLSHVAVLTTARGAERPMQIAWTRPFLPQVAPLSLKAAIETWDAICAQRDAFSERLIQAVDCVPLAVTLLAHLAESETSEVLWVRWQQEQTDLLKAHGPGNRLNNVDVSIQLSLQGPRLRVKENAVQFFAVICTLPQGVLESRIPILSEAFSGILPNFPRMITLLKQCSLIHSSEDGYLRVLSPIRHYMLVHHPIPDPLFTCLAGVYRKFAYFTLGDYTAKVTHTKSCVLPELGNTTSILMRCLTQGGQLSEETLLVINSFARLCLSVSYYDTSLLTEAINHAEAPFPALTAHLWYSKAECLFYQHNNMQALSAYASSQKLYASVHNLSGEAGCWWRLGCVYLRLNWTAQAEEVLETALELYTRANSYSGQAYTLETMSNLYRLINRLDDAERALRSALDLFDQVGDRLGKANALKSLGRLCVQLKKYEDAESTLRSAHALYDAIGSPMGRGNCLQSLGLLYVSLQRLEEAQSTFQSALALYREVGSLLGELNMSNNLGSIFRGLHRFDEARDMFLLAQDLSNSLMDSASQGRTMRNLGLLYEDIGQCERAEECLLEAFQAYERASDPRNADVTREDLDRVRTQAILPGTAQHNTTLHDSA